MQRSLTRLAPSGLLALLMLMGCATRAHPTDPTPLSQKERRVLRLAIADIRRDVGTATADWLMALLDANRIARERNPDNIGETWPAGTLRSGRTAVVERSRDAAGSRLLVINPNLLAAETGDGFELLKSVLVRAAHHGRRTEAGFAGGSADAEAESGWREQRRWYERYGKRSQALDTYFADPLHRDDVLVVAR